MMTLEKTTGTTGFITAKINGEPFEASDASERPIQFYLDITTQRWTVVAEQPVPDSLDSRLISFSIPDEGNVVDKTYDIVRSGTPGMASYWWIQGDSGVDIYPGISGTITISINRQEQTAIGSFHFTAKQDGASKEISIDEGTFNVKGFSTSERSASSGKVTADVEGGSTPVFDSSTVSLTHQAGHPEKGPFWRGWSEQVIDPSDPGKRTVILSVDVDDTLGVGTYDLSAFRDKISMIYIVLRGSVTGYVAETGTLTLTSVPAKGSAQGKLEGSFEFESKPVNDVIVKVSNGKLFISNE